jgi:acetylornithine deacetylase/succinyl-diaminopimelate desuccinylase-like protein
MHIAVRAFTLLASSLFLYGAYRTLIVVPGENPQPATLRVTDQQHGQFMQGNKALDRAHRLASSIRFRTVSTTSGNTTEFHGELEKLHAYLVDTFPRVHGTLTREIINGYSLLYTWMPELDRPMMLCAHMDVVPIDERTRSSWSVDPFGGVIRDGFIYGRGSLDFKVQSPHDEHFDDF